MSPNSKRTRVFNSKQLPKKSSSQSQSLLSTDRLVDNVRDQYGQFIGNNADLARVDHHNLPLEQIQNHLNQNRLQRKPLITPFSMINEVMTESRGTSGQIQQHRQSIEYISNADLQHQITQSSHFYQDNNNVNVSSYPPIISSADPNYMQNQSQNGSNSLQQNQQQPMSQVKIVRESKSSHCISRKTAKQNAQFGQLKHSNGHPFTAAAQNQEARQSLNNFRQLEERLLSEHSLNNLVQTKSFQENEGKIRRGSGPQIQPNFNKDAEDHPLKVRKLSGTVAESNEAQMVGFNSGQTNLLDQPESGYALLFENSKPQSPQYEKTPEKIKKVQKIMPTFVSIKNQELQIPPLVLNQNVHQDMQITGQELNINVVQRAKLELNMRRKSKSGFMAQKRPQSAIIVDEHSRKTSLGQNSQITQLQENENSINNLHTIPEPKEPQTFQNDILQIQGSKLNVSRSKKLNAQPSANRFKNVLNEDSQPQNSPDFSHNDHSRPKIALKVRSRDSNAFPLQTIKEMFNNFNQSRGDRQNAQNQGSTMNMVYNQNGECEEPESASPPTKHRISTKQLPTEQSLQEYLHDKSLQDKQEQGKNLESNGPLLVANTINMSKRSQMFHYHRRSSTEKRQELTISQTNSQNWLFNGQQMQQRNEIIVDQRQQFDVQQQKQKNQNLDPAQNSQNFVKKQNPILVDKNQPNKIPQPQTSIQNSRKQQNQPTFNNHIKNGVSSSENNNTTSQIQDTSTLVMANQQSSSILNCNNNDLSEFGLQNDRDAQIVGIIENGPSITNPDISSQEDQTFFAGQPALSGSSVNQNEIQQNQQVSTNLNSHQNTKILRLTKRYQHNDTSLTDNLPNAMAENNISSAALTSSKENTILGKEPFTSSIMGKKIVPLASIQQKNVSSVYFKRKKSLNKNLNVSTFGKSDSKRGDMVNKHHAREMTFGQNDLDHPSPLIAPQTTKLNQSQKAKVVSNSTQRTLETSRSQPINLLQKRIQTGGGLFNGGKQKTYKINADVLKVLEDKTILAAKLRKQPQKEKHSQFKRLEKFTQINKDNIIPSSTKSSRRDLNIEKSIKRGMLTDESQSLSAVNQCYLSNELINGGQRELNLNTLVQDKGIHDRQSISKQKVFDPMTFGPPSVTSHTPNHISSLQSSPEQMFAQRPSQMLVLKSTRNINENSKMQSFQVKITSSAKKGQSDQNASTIEDTRDSIRHLVSGNASRPGHMMQSIASYQQNSQNLKQIQLDVNPMKLQSEHNQDIMTNLPLKDTDLNETNKLVDNLGQRLLRSESQKQLSKSEFKTLVARSRSMKTLYSRQSNEQTGETCRSSMKNGIMRTSEIWQGINHLKDVQKLNSQQIDHLEKIQSGGHQWRQNKTPHQKSFKQQPWISSAKNFKTRFGPVKDPFVKRYQPLIDQVNRTSQIKELAQKARAENLLKHQKERQSKETQLQILQNEGHRSAFLNQIRNDNLLDEQQLQNMTINQRQIESADAWKVLQNLVMRDGRVFDLNAVLGKIADLDFKNDQQNDQMQQIWAQEQQKWDILTGLPFELQHQNQQMSTDFDTIEDSQKQEQVVGEEEVKGGVIGNNQFDQNHFQMIQQIPLQPVEAENNGQIEQFLAPPPNLLQNQFVVATVESLQEKDGQDFSSNKREIQKDKLIE